MGISDITGDIVAEYVHDCWGKLISITDSEGNNVTENPDHIGFINPIRYRGYYYDSETGLYYLNARYYDPETCRFLNADETLKGGYNLFRYCYNNPIIFFDPDGTKSIYVIYYDPKEGATLKEQALNSPFYKNSDVTEFKPVSTVKQFIDAWNSLPTNPYRPYPGESIDELYLYLHGGKGALYFYKEDMYLSDKGEYSFSSLKNKRIKRLVLVTCCGGEGFEGENLAWFFSGLTGAKVFACSGKVSFNYDKGLHVFRPRISWKTPFALFKTFWYEWDGRNKAKERIGWYY